MTGSGDFTIRGTAQRPVILGTITLDEGTLSLENNRYEITALDSELPLRLDRYGSMSDTTPTLQVQGASRDGIST